MNTFNTSVKAENEVKREEEGVSVVFDSLKNILIAIAILAGVVIVGCLIFKFVK